MTEEREQVIRFRLGRSRESLAEARLLLENNHPNACVSRLYYACFYAVSALLLTEGKSSSKHAGVRALFDREWGKTGRVSVEIVRFYRDLFKRRQTSDYMDLVLFEERDVRGWLAQAEDTVSLLNDLAENQLRNQSNA